MIYLVLYLPIPVDLLLR